MHECIMEPRPVVHHPSGHIKTGKASKMCPKCFIAIRLLLLEVGSNLEQSWAEL